MPWRPSTCRQENEQEARSAAGNRKPRDAAAAGAALLQSALPNQHGRLWERSVLVSPAQAAGCPQRWPLRKHGGFTASKNVDLLSLSFAPCKGPGDGWFISSPQVLDTQTHTYFSFSLPL